VTPPHGKDLTVGCAERGTYWRGRHKTEAGWYGTVSDDRGETIRFTSKRAAKKAADDEEAKVRSGTWRDPAAGRITFGIHEPLVQRDLPRRRCRRIAAIEGTAVPEYADHEHPATDITAWEGGLALEDRPASAAGGRSSRDPG
jgi:hypothetical protein